MMSRRLYLSWFLWRCVWVLVAAEDCIYTQCECDGTSVSCNDRRLSSMPQPVGSSDNIEIVNFDDNMISTIPAGSFPPNLKQISIMGNPLTSIDDTAFDTSANTLEFIALSNVLFTRLPDAFVHLKSLYTFIVYYSNILDWNVNAMKNVGNKLETLYVENCGLTKWPAWMQYFTNLKELSLSSNSFSSIPDDALDKLANSLTTLVLINSSLTSVPKALSKLAALRTLYLQQNQISNVTWLPQASRLMSLSLNINYIFDDVQLSKALLPYGDSLNEFNIENNRLTAIPNCSFLTQIGGLDFSNNRISDSISGSLSSGISELRLESNLLQRLPTVLQSAHSVTDMVLNSNMIRNLQAVDFPSWTIGAELGNNFITELTDSSFPKNCSLQFLHLNNNPVSQISNHVFQNLPNLYELNLQNTQLTRLPLGLSSAISLHVIDFTGSQNLICTCMEQSLQYKIMLLLQENVSGNCGQTSIYNFFNILSPSCPEDLAL